MIASLVSSLPFQKKKTGFVANEQLTFQLSIEKQWFRHYVAWNIVSHFGSLQLQSDRVYKGETNTVLVSSFIGIAIRVKIVTFNLSDSSS